MKVHISDYSLLSSKNKSQEMIIEAHLFKPSIAIIYLLKPGLNVQD